MRGWRLWSVYSALIIGLGSVPLRADIYMYRDTRGLLHFSNAPTEPQYQY